MGHYPLWLIPLCFVPIFIAMIGIGIDSGQKNISDHQTTHTGYCSTLLNSIELDKKAKEPPAVIINDQDQYAKLCSS